MMVWRELDLQQQLSLASMVVIVLLMLLNEIERIVTDRVKDRHKQKVLCSIVYLFRQIFCITILILLISINMVLRGKWV